jgi:hypothetical protein
MLNPTGDDRLVYVYGKTFAEADRIPRVNLRDRTAKVVWTRCITGGMVHAHIPASQT